MNNPSKVLLLPCLILFIDALAAGIAIPYIPEIINHIKSEHLEFGSRISIFFALLLGQVVIGPIWAQSVRWLPWSLTVLISFLAFGLGFFTLARSQTFILSVIVLILPGLSVATTIVTLSVLSRAVPDGRQSEGQGIGFAMIAAGFTIGPVLSGGMEFDSVTIVLQIAGILCLVGALIAAVALFPFFGGLNLIKQKPRQLKIHKNNQKKKSDIGFFFACLGVTAALLAASSQPFTLMWPLISSEAFNFGPSQIGFSFSIFTGLIALANIFLVSKIERFSEKQISCFLIFVAGFYLLSAFYMSPLVVAPVAVIVALLSCAPAILIGRAMCSLQTDKSCAEYEFINTVFFFAGVLGTVLGSSTSFLAFDHTIIVFSNKVNIALLFSAVCVVGAWSALQVGFTTTAAKRDLKRE